MASSERLAALSSMLPAAAFVEREFRIDQGALMGGQPAWRH